MIGIGPTQPDLRVLERKKCRHALEYLRSARPEKRNEKKCVFLRERLTIIYLFEGLWSVGDTLLLLAPLLGPQRKSLPCHPLPQYDTKYCYLLAGLLAEPRAQNKKKSYVHIKMNKASYRNPGESSYPLLQKKKKKMSACHVLQRARIAPRPRPKCPNGLPVSTFLAFYLKVFIRTDMFENKRKNDKHHCTCYIRVDSASGIRGGDNFRR